MKPLKNYKTHNFIASVSRIVVGCYFVNIVMHTMLSSIKDVAYAKLMLANLIIVFN